MYLTNAEFETLVEEAIDSLPDEFADLLENIVIVVEQEPSEEDLEVLEEQSDSDELLGIYRGVSRARRTFDMLPTLPDQIAIFRGPILRCARSRRHAIQEVRQTVIHELGHHFGLSDEEMIY